MRDKLVAAVYYALLAAMTLFALSLLAAGPTP